ncbi:MAG TPA: tetratricopeptide repeat protein [Planctomycetota bacterium]
MNAAPRPRDRAAQRCRWLLAIVAGLACVAYAAALGGEYVFDDMHSIAENPALHQDLSWWRLLSDPSAFSPGSGRMYRPVLLLSFAANLAISPAVSIMKAGNVLLHAGVAALLFVWLRGLSRRTTAAFAVASLFAVHPLVSESVNLVSARSELLCAFGLLVGLCCHWRWHRSRRLRFVPGMVVGAVLACGSKETGVLLPGLLLVQAFLLRHHRWTWTHWRRAVAGVVPVLVVVLAYLVLRKILLGQVGAPLLGRTGADPTSGHGRSLLVQFATMGTLLPKALLQTVVPVGLSFDPPVWYRHSFFDPTVLLGWGGLLGATAAAAWRGPTAGLRRLGVLFAWTVALPWIVIPLNMPMAEHRLYAVMLGLGALAVALLPRVRPDGARGPWAAGPWLHPAFLVLVLLGIGTSAARSLHYRDERILWQNVLAQHPNSFRGWWGLGSSLWRYGDVPAAIEPLARAHFLCPTHYDALVNYAEALVLLPDEKAQPFRSLVVSDALAARGNEDAWARTLQAQARLQAGRTTGEREYFEVAEQLALSCLQIAPPKGYVYRLAASARRGLGDLDGALAHLDASIARGLDHFTVRLDRAAVLRDLGRHADARRELLQAQRSAPMEPAVMQALHQLAQPPR